MSPSASRINACDRCRGQKLRCVRQPEADDRPCDRCRKAGAECINTLYSRRRDATEGEKGIYGPSAHENNPEAVINLSRARDSPSGYMHGRASIGGSFHRPPMIDAGLPTMKFGTSQLAQSHKRNSPHSLLERPFKRTSHASSFRQVGSTGLQNDIYQAAFSQDSIANDGGSRRSRSTSLPFVQLDDNNNITSGKKGTDSDLSTSAFSLGVGLDPMITSHQLNGPRKLPPSPLLSVPDCLQCLVELSSRLIKATHDYSGSCKTLDDLLSFKTSDSQPEPVLQNAIGSVLESSQTLLNVLYSLKDLNSAAEHAPGSNRSLANSECSYSELWEMNTLTPTLGAENLSEASSSTSVFPSITGPPPPFAKQPTETPSSSLDVPTTFTSLTCYIWLLYTYDTVFSSIEAFLNADMPCIIPGLTVGGFDLDGHKDLQVDIFMQLSTKMLSRIEDALGIDGTAAISNSSSPIDGHHRLHDRNNVTQALLDAMFWGKDGKADVAARIWEKTTRIRNALQHVRTMG